MSKRNDTLYLKDIIESILAIESFLDDMDYEAFVNDRKTYSATLRELEVIGEARLSEEVKSLHPEVNWRTLKDFRNVLAHEYFGVNAVIVWDIVQDKLPQLKKEMNAIISSLK
jgi:uncharacterized protein with HEPN domain